MLKTKKLAARVRVGAALLATPFASWSHSAAAATSAEITAGAAHTCARKADSSLYCWGKNARGELGDGTTTSRSVPTLVGLGAVLEVSARVEHTCARTATGAAFCWGENDTGAVGDGTLSDRRLPTPVTGLGAGVAQIVSGGYHSCARKTDQTLWCWGWNALGQLGDGTTTTRQIPVQVAALGSTVVEVTAGDYHACARKSDGTLWCWGHNSLGELGDGSTDDHVTPTQITFLANVVREVTAGNEHTCARLDDGSLWCWGANESGQIGKNDTISRQNPVQVLTNVVRVAAAGHHTCATKGDQSLWCWGRRDHGQLGDGVLGSPQLTPASIPLPATASVLELAGGDLHGCTHHNDGSLYCEGKGTEGQVGDGANVDRAAPVLVMTGLSSYGPAKAPATSRPWATLLCSLLVGSALLLLHRRKRAPRSLPRSA